MKNDRSRPERSNGSGNIQAGKRTLQNDIEQENVGRGTPHMFHCRRAGTVETGDPEPCFGKRFFHHQRDKDLIFDNQNEWRIHLKGPWSPAERRRDLNEVPSSPEQARNDVWTSDWFCSISYRHTVVLRH
jgi:hypothetical protein